MSVWWPGLPRVGSSIRKATTTAALLEEETTDESALLARFGEYADLPILNETDWDVLAEAVQNFNAIVLDALEKHGKVPFEDLEFVSKIQAENLKLAKLAIGLSGQVPTHSMGNGEYTHPIVQSNLIGAILKKSGLPLSDDQLKSIEEVGGKFEKLYSEAQGDYTDSTPVFSKVSSFQELMTVEQAEALYHPDIEGTQFDVLSPLLMAGMSGKPLQIDSLEQGGGQFREAIATLWGLNETEMGVVGGTVDQTWDSLVDSVSHGDGMLDWRLDDVIAAGEAQAALAEKLLNAPGLSEETRQKIINAKAWSVRR